MPIVQVFCALLLKTTPYYPTPRDLLASNSLERLREKDKESILELAASRVGVPGDTYQWLIGDLGIPNSSW